MKPFTRIQVALLFLICLSLSVMLLGSASLAAPSELASPYVSTMSPKFVKAVADAKMQAEKGATVSDMIRLPQAVGQAEVDSTVQTADLTLPAYSVGANGVPTGATPDNRDPVWSTVTENFIIFSSNRTSATNPTPSSNYHLFAISPSGNANSIMQLTTGTGNEFYPSVLEGDTSIAFCEGASANPNGNLTLYVAPLTGAISGIPINPTVNGSVAIPYASGPTGYYVRHPSYNGQLIAFAGTPTTNPGGTYHIYTVNINTSLVTTLTSGVSDDENPAFSSDGGLVAFDTNAAAFNSSNVSAVTQATRNIYFEEALGQQQAIQFTNSFSSSIQPEWTQNVANPLLNPNANVLYIFFTRTVSAGNTDIFYLMAGYYPSQTGGGFTPVAEGGSVPNVGTNAPVQVITSEPLTGGQYSNTEPAVGRLRTFVAVTYMSQRFVVNPINENPLGNASNPNDIEPQNTPTSGGANELLMSQLFDVDPPAILPYNSSTDEIVHTELTSSETGSVPGSGPSQRQFAPGQQMTFVVRLSDRQTGVGDVFLQIKDPNSKYQEGSGLEHKVFTRQGPQFSLPGSPALDGVARNEATDLFSVSGAAIAGVESDQPVEVGNLMPPTGNYVGSATIGGTQILPPGTAVIPVTNLTGSMALGETAVGYGIILEIGTGADIEYQSYNAFNAASSPPGITITPTINSHGPGEPITVWKVFDPLGQEVDCEAINANGGNQVDATQASDFQVPIYTAGLSDTPLSGDDVIGTGAPGAPTVWLPLAILPAQNQDNNGGVLYSATWTAPTLPSDWYVDVIAFDNAIYPIPYDVGSGFVNDPGFDVDSFNWRIYDNIWGMTTANFSSDSGVLVVDDYALPQKFFSTRFNLAAGLASPNNVSGLLPDTYFGAESYVTDIDDSYDNDVLGGFAEAALPNYAFQAPVNLTPPAPVVPPPAQVSPIYHASDLAGLGTSRLASGEWPWSQPSTGQPFDYSYLGGYANSLGVNSYADSDQEGGISDIPQRDNAPAADSQGYDIWRILSRGPLPDSYYSDYAPSVELQPANPLQAGSKPTLVPVASRCILWVSPFTGDEFAGPGTLADANTQSQLENFLNAGGRLYVEGIDVGYALTSNGNVPNNFYNDYLQAAFVNDDAGWAPGTVQLSGSAGTTDYISHDAYRNNLDTAHNNRNFREHGEFIVPDTSLPFFFHYAPPAEEPLTIGNVGFVNPVLDLDTTRTDVSLNEVGSEEIEDQSWIDSFNPLNSSPVELTGHDTFSNDLIYYINPANGSEMSYSSFGLEAMSQEIQTFTPFTPAGATLPDPYFVTRNQRTNLMHNMICFLRTGSLKGTVTSTGTAGQPVANAIIVATLFPGGIGPTYTGETNAQGLYQIDGLPAGLYQFTAYAAGFFQHGEQNANLALHGGDYSELNLQINPAPPGSLQVTVTDANTSLPINNVTVTATDVAGAVTYTAVTGANGSAAGVASFGSVEAGNYNITYNAVAAGYSNTPVSQVPPNPVTVTSGQQETVATTLTQAPSTVYGLVEDASGNVLTSGTVTITNSSNQVMGTTSIVPQFNATGTGEDGQPANYSVNVPAGTNYTVTASSSGLTSESKQLATVASAQAYRVDFTPGSGGGLPTAPTGFVYGLVESSPSGGLVAGATLTFTDQSNVAHPFTTSGTTSSAPDGGTENYQTTQLPAGQYTVKVSATGLVSPPPQVVIIPGLSSIRLDFTGAEGLQALHTFSSSLQFFSIPYDYSASGLTLAQMFGYPSPVLAVWVPSQGAYVETPTFPADTIRNGQGYWARFPSSVGLANGGVPATTSNPFSISLGTGWNMIGDPYYQGSVNLSSIMVADAHGVLHSWASATGNQLHLVNPILWSYNSVTNQYVLHYVGTTVGKTQDSFPTLDPYTGYWIDAYTPCTLSITAP